VTTGNSISDRDFQAGTYFPDPSAEQELRRRNFQPRLDKLKARAEAEKRDRGLTIGRDIYGTSGITPEEAIRQSRKVNDSDKTPGFQATAYAKSLRDEAVQKFKQSDDVVTSGEKELIAAMDRFIKSMEANVSAVAEQKLKEESSTLTIDKQAQIKILIDKAEGLESQGGRIITEEEYNAIVAKLATLRAETNALNDKTGVVPAPTS
jgi:hypothetical protein